VELDGMFNARNIPLTTLHSNIWYHLGLAYYLKQDWENALDAFNNCRELGLNDDNLVSSTHWIYMILRRMGDEAAAQAALSPIHAEMDIIENASYWKLCRFYQGELAEAELIDPEDSFSANDAVRYGLANWHLYHGRTGLARRQLQAIVEADGWNSFGHIAAEVDLVLMI
jgi:lipoprotein NlpI